MHTAQFIFRNQNVEFRQAEPTKSIMYFDLSCVWNCVQFGILSQWFLNLLSNQA